MKHADYSYINWSINGSWGSFSSYGFLRFTWTEIESFKEHRKYMSLGTLTGIWKNIAHTMRHCGVFCYEIEYHFSDDMPECRRQKFILAINKCIEKYGIEANEEKEA